MPKPKRIEIRRIGGLVVPRRHSLASALTMLTACLAVGSALAQRAAVSYTHLTLPTIYSV